ncbi:Scramblase [Rozella allomycis CSF55]|uniref:Phospholipid scramblase n=1 Tax=Rozella allomycis (strain CSF55) TaxID=988480 RepID=A0A4P9YIA8_ROZAC|nr:Scramblase [Rozella allomycis CSF55]
MTRDIAEKKKTDIIKSVPNLTDILSNDVLVICRQIEWMRIVTGFDQANQYVIYDQNAKSNTIGRMFTRQIAGTHRPFEAFVLDLNSNVIMKINRPFTLINSKLTVTDGTNGNIFGLIHQKNNQFASINEGFLAWDFTLRDEVGKPLSYITRNWTNLAQELFTDAGKYVIQFKNIPGQSRELTFEEKAVTLGCSTAIDLDYFTRYLKFRSVK